MRDGKEIKFLTDSQSMKQGLRGLPGVIIIIYNLG
jgi:hypothetical protein